MKKIYRTYLPATAYVLLAQMSGAATAQTHLTQEEEDRRNAALDNTLGAEVAVVSPNLGPSASLTTSSGSGKASIAYTMGDTDFDGRGQKNNYSLSFSAPLNSETDEADFANLDGLANAFSFSFKFSRVSRHPGRGDTLGDLCGSVSTKTLGMLKAARARLYANDKVTAAIEDAEGVKPTAPSLSDPCTKVIMDLDRPGDKLLRLEEPEAYRVKYYLANPSRPLSFWGGEVKIGYNDFSFLNPEKFASLNAFSDSEIKDTLSQEEFPWSASVHYGEVLRNGWILKGSFRYERKFEETSSTIRCPAAEPGETFDCLSGKADAPNGKKAYVASVELKKVYSLFGARQAFALNTSYDFKSDTIGIDFPIYLLPDAKGKLSGGIRFGWRSDTKNPVFGVFVGAPFSIL